MAAASLGRDLAERCPGAICVAVTCGILIACLWPFHAPANAARWLREENGLEFEAPGTAVSVGELKPAAADAPCSIELWVQPALIDDSSTILAFHTARSPVPLSIQQSESDLKLRLTPAAGPHTRRTRDLYVDRVFRSTRPLFITIASGTRDATVFLNGVPARRAVGYRISASECSGRIVLATAPTGNDAWKGRVFGLAVYYQELTAEQTARHYSAWTSKGRPNALPGERCGALYLFDERRGDLAHDRAGSGPDLRIPQKYQIVDQAFLMPLWKEPDVPDMLRNIAGFVPLGFFLYAWLASKSSGSRGPALVAVTIAALLSLAIEVLQSHLPTRQSDAMDVLTNMLGAWMGGWLCGYWVNHPRLKARACSCG